MTLKDLLKAIYASLNSGGGVVEIKISDYSDMKEGTFWTKLDRFQQIFENKLKPVIEPLSYCDLIDRDVEKYVLFVFYQGTRSLEYFKSGFVSGW